MALRFASAALLSIGVTFALFYLMQALISMGAAEADKIFAGQVIEFVRLKRTPELELKKRRMPDRKPPEEEPPPPELNLSRVARPEQGLDTMMIEIGHQVEIGGALDLGVIASDQEPVPIVRIDAIYPTRAAERGIEGWVEVEFTISAAGTVKDPVVTASKPGKIFNRAALRAIRRWKYSPKIEDGVAVERTGVKTRINFGLENGQ